MLSHLTLRQRRSQKTLSSPRPRQHAHPPPLARPPRRRPPPAPLHLRRHPLGVFPAYAGEPYPLSPTPYPLGPTGLSPAYAGKPPPQGNCIKSVQTHLRLPESVGAPLVGALRGLLWRPNLDAIALFSLPLRAPSRTKKVFFVVLRGPSWTKKGVLHPPIPLAKSAHMCDNSLQPNPRRPTANSRQPQ